MTRLLPKLLAVLALLWAAPAPGGLNAAFAKQGPAVALAITGEALKGADLSEAYFFPFDSTVIDHAKPHGKDGCLR